MNKEILQENKDYILAKRINIINKKPFYKLTLLNLDKYKSIKRSIGIKFWIKEIILDLDSNTCSFIYNQDRYIRTKYFIVLDKNPKEIWFYDLIKYDL